MRQEAESEREWFQILAICLAGISSFSCGLFFSWPSPSIPKIVADKTNYDISLDEASYFTVLPSVGLIVSCIAYSKLIDVIGRKYTLLSVAIPHILASVLTANARSVYVFYVARFVNGIGDACIFGVLPVYVGEVASPKIRGTWGNSMSFLLYLGIFVTNVIGNYYSVSATAYICLSVPIVFACTFVFMPETPYFYLMKGRYEDAKKSLQKLRWREDVDEELQKLKSDVERQLSESGTWKDLFCISSNRKAIYAGIFLRAAQQMGGISTFETYTQYIFLKSGGDMSATTSTLIFTALCAALNLAASFTLDRFGRKKSYFYSCLFCGITLLVETVYFFIEQYYPDLDLTIVNWIPVAGMILYVLFFSFGLGIVPTLMLGELFSASIKGKGLFLMNIVLGILVSTMTKLFHVLDTNIGLYSPFLFFASSCLISTVLSLFIVPETKGKTLEEIQLSLKGAKKQINDAETK